MLSMNSIKIFVILVYIFIAAYIDIKNKYIDIYLVILGFMIAIILYLFMPYNLFELLIGIAVGIIVSIISFCTKQSVGFGDGIILIILGIVFGLSTINIFLYSIIILLVYSILMFLFIKKYKLSTIPFIPFLFIGIILEILL